MSDQWFKDYIQLQFRIDRSIRKFTESRFVDYYYGPQEWKATVEHEAETPAPELVRAATTLLDTLPEQGFEEHRALYLSKQVVALETVCRKLNGEIFALEDEVQRCFDIRPTWTPETLFEEAHTLLDEALPGSGSITERMNALLKGYELAPAKSGQVLDFMRMGMDEARRRTQLMVELPANENVELETITNRSYYGNNQYMGSFRSHVEVNLDLPIDMRWLMGFVSHEAYPGHHTEFVLKEQSLYRERGYIEQTIAPIISPQSVISEGIATSALKMIFTYAETEQWAREHLYPVAGIEPLDVDSEKLAKAEELMAGIEGNARFMLSDGCSDDEVVQYIMRYRQEPEMYARKTLEFLKEPFQEGYIFTYFYGRRLMKPWLQGDDRCQAFKRFLTEQICPSDLVQNV